MRFSQRQYIGIVPLLLILSLSGCVGSSSSSSPTTEKIESRKNFALNYNSVKGRVSPREMEEFRKKDKERARAHLDKHPINKEVTHPRAVENLKDLLSLMPSHLLERYKNIGGSLEYDSKRFTDKDERKGVIAKRSEVDPRRIVFNTHVDKRFYTTLQKDLAVELIAKQQFALEYDKYGFIASPDYDPVKKAILIESYRDFLTKVLLDELSGNNFTNEAKDFFFGENSALHKLTSNNQFTREVIENNIEVIHQGMAKAITYHREMNSHKGSDFLARRFPHTNELISKLYFMPHSDSSPHLRDARIPSLLVKDLNYVMQQFQFSSDAFSLNYSKYIASERLGQYIASDTKILNEATLNVRKMLETSREPIINRIGRIDKVGIGNSDIQAFELAYILRSHGVAADIKQIVSDKGLSQYLVHVVYDENNEYYVDPWRGLIIPDHWYKDYYPDFSHMNSDSKLNGLLPDQAKTIKSAEVKIVSLPNDSVVKKALDNIGRDVSILNYRAEVPSKLYRGSAFAATTPPSDPKLLDERLVAAIKHTSSQSGSAGAIQSYSADITIAMGFARKEKEAKLITQTPQAGDVVMSTKEILVRHADRLIREGKIQAGTVNAAVRMLATSFGDEDEYFWLLAAPNRN